MAIENRKALRSASKCFIRSVNICLLFSGRKCFWSKNNRKHSSTVLACFILCRKYVNLRFRKNTELNCIMTAFQHNSLSQLCIANNSDEVKSYKFLTACRHYVRLKTIEWKDSDGWKDKLLKGRQSYRDWKARKRGGSFSRKRTSLKQITWKIYFSKTSYRRETTLPKISCFCWKRKCLSELAKKSLLFPKKITHQTALKSFDFDTLQLLISKIISKYLKVFLAEW